MSLINEYRATEEAIKELQDRLNHMKDNDELKKEMEFEEKLRNVMGEYGKSLRDIIALLDPDRLKKNRASAPAATHRRTRSTKCYTNPHTNEEILTKGGNHKILKEWKTKWGADEVESWAVVR
ncbi:H-NS histone (plasmid) [Pseudomonas putida]|uniref:histone-like nucleoid-structuring protein MvaT n=1 Tax=Pseudomonas putida TaxID=303 RepID=UPI001BB04B1E|nr:histone-like nucleoid-structuring protein MvaT [Pseudomonas putida]QUG93379.1 H-NS histone [Pseudomonas putida]